MSYALNSRSSSGVKRRSDLMAYQSPEFNNLQEQDDLFSQKLFIQEERIYNIGKITQPEIDDFFVKSPKMSLIEQNMEESKIEKKDSLERLI